MENDKINQLVDKLEEFENEYEKKQINYFLENSKKFNKIYESKQNKKIRKFLDKSKSLYKYNFHKLIMNGTKDTNYLMYNDSYLDKDTDIYDFEHLYAYAKHNQEFQRSFLDNTYEFDIAYSNDYLYLDGDFFRFISADNKLWYLSTYSIESYIYQKVEMKITKYLKKILPNSIAHPFYEESFIKQENNLYRFNDKIETRALGKESFYEEINKYIGSSKYFNEMIIVIRKYIQNLNIQNCVFLDIKETKWDKQMDLIILNTETAKNIKFDTFLQNIYDFEQPIQYVKNIIKDVTKEMKLRLLEKYFN